MCSLCDEAHNRRVEGGLLSNEPIQKLQNVYFKKQGKIFESGIDKLNKAKIFL